MKPTPSTHSDFVIERRFDAAPDAVFQAWADPPAKQSWSDCHSERGSDARFDFRPAVFPRTFRAVETPPFKD